jgi:hypothetical protein
MRTYTVCVACVLLLSSAVALAGGQDKGARGEGKAKAAASAPSGGAGEEKVIGGMSIVGNNETPKALVIVPWKSSEIGQETKLKSDLLNDSLTPVDHEVFMRELNFYKLANPK